MLKERECNIKRYDVEYFKGFILEIEDKGEMVDFWLGHEKIGQKSYMFGLYKKDVPTLEDILSIAIGNLPHHIKMYNDEFMNRDKYFETLNLLENWRKMIGECDEDELEEACGCCPYCVHEAAKKE